MSWGTADQTFTISPVSITHDSATQSTVVNVETLETTAGKAVDDILVFGQVKLAFGTSGSDKMVHVYGYGTVGGTTYPDTVTGSAGSITLNNPTQLKIIGRIHATTGGTTYRGGPWSMRVAFGGTLPSRVGLVVLNRTNITLASASSDHAFTYQVALGQSIT